MAISEIKTITPGTKQETYITLSDSNARELIPQKKNVYLDGINEFDYTESYSIANGTEIVFKDIVSVGSIGSSVSFTSNGNSYTGLYVSYLGICYGTPTYDSTKKVYDFTTQTWTNNAYKTITLSANWACQRTHLKWILENYYSIDSDSVTQKGVIEFTPTKENIVISLSCESEKIEQVSQKSIYTITNSDSSSEHAQFNSIHIEDGDNAIITLSIDLGYYTDSENITLSTQNTWSYNESTKQLTIENVQSDIEVTIETQQADMVTGFIQPGMRDGFVTVNGEHEVVGTYSSNYSGEYTVFADTHTAPGDTVFFVTIDNPSTDVWYSFIIYYK